MTSKKNRVGSFVDADSMTDDRNLTRFKMYHNFMGYKKFRGILIGRLIGETVIDCEDKTIGYEEEQLGVGDGRIAVKELKLEPKGVRANSVHAGILIFVCGYDGKINASLVLDSI